MATRHLTLASIKSNKIHENKFTGWDHKYLPNKQNAELVCNIFFIDWIRLKSKWLNYNLLGHGQNTQFLIQKTKYFCIIIPL